MNNLPKRKNIRLKNFDYSKQGAYFITICTQNKKYLLSNIIDDDNPHLLMCGKIADKWINKIAEKYPQYTVDCYVIMPNHIHLLLSVMNGEEASTSVVSVVGWLKYQITKEFNLINDTPKTKIFQRSFYDHIVRNYNDYEEIYKYIFENPLKWRYDKLYTE